MSAFVDTSVLVCYLTGSPPEMLATAKAIVDETEALHLTGVVIAETAYVLLSFYEVPRVVVTDSLIDLLGKVNLRTHDLNKELAIQALLLCRSSNRVSVADALLWATARSTAPTPYIYSLDKRFPGEGVELLRKVTL